jgi:hypothetical protein
MHQYLFLENNKEKIERISISGHFGPAFLAAQSNSRAVRLVVAWLAQ